MTYDMAYKAVTLLNLLNSWVRCAFGNVEMQDGEKRCKDGEEMQKHGRKKHFGSEYQKIRLDAKIGEEIFRDRWQLLDTHHYWLPVTEPPHT